MPPLWGGPPRLPVKPGRALEELSRRVCGLNFETTSFTHLARFPSRSCREGCVAPDPEGRTCMKTGVNNAELLGKLSILPSKILLARKEKGAPSQAPCPIRELDEMLLHQAHFLRLIKLPGLKSIEICAAGYFVALRIGTIPNNRFGASIFLPLNQNLNLVAQDIVDR